jgi:hypothetical protein
MSLIYRLYSLELNIHELILSDLADNIGLSKDNVLDDTLESSVDLITSQVETRAVSGDEDGERVFMVRCIYLVYVVLAHTLPSLTRESNAILDLQNSQSICPTLTSKKRSLCS